MQIHELNDFTGILGTGSFVAVDNGVDTGKVSTEQIIADTKEEISKLDSFLNARIDNIIAGGAAPSEAEIVDARLGADGNVYPSLGDAIRGQIDDLQAYIDPREITGRYVDTTDGVLRLDSNYNVFVYNVYGLSEVIITPHYTTARLTYAFYKADGSYLENSSGTFASASANVISVPEGAYTIKFSSIIYQEATITASWGKLVATKAAVKENSDAISSLNDETSFELFIRTNYADMDPSQTGYLNLNGQVVSYANTYCSDFIKVKAGSVVKYKTAYIYGVSIAAGFYDANKAFIPGSEIVAQSGTSGSFVGIEGEATVPQNAVYIRFTVSKNTNGGIPKEKQYYSYTTRESIKDYLENIIIPDENSWRGKSWCCFGTSLTDTSYINPETGEVTGKYVPFLKELSGLTVTNRGIAGGTLGSGGIHGGSSNILNAILNSNDLDVFDLITIEGFVNDFACAITIGDIGDTQNTTFYGALHQAISYCLEHSHAEVVLITETTGKLYTMQGGGTADYTILHKNSLDLYQQAYNDAMIRIGQYYGVHVIDAGGKSQINQYHPEYIIDQIHHTTVGGEQYANTIWEELKNIKPASVDESE